MKNITTNFNAKFALPLATLFTIILLILSWPVDKAKSSQLPDSNQQNPTTQSDNSQLNQTQSSSVPSAPPQTDNSLVAAANETSVKIVVNLPAMELSLIENNQVIKTYPVTIAAPRYAMPIEPFEASHLIWNPSWTPPPSPWAAKARPYRPGEAGNPLGPMKIRLGGPYLIHGGGDESVGRALSHGCIRMRNEDVLELAKLIIETRKLSISNEQFEKLHADRHREHGIKIDPIIPVEIKYQTITIADKQVAIYPDVYHRGTNSLSKLKTTLAAAGIEYAKLAVEDQLALEKMLKDGVEKVSNYELGKSVNTTPEVADNRLDLTATQ